MGIPVNVTIRFLNEQQFVEISIISTNLLTLTVKNIQCGPEVCKIWSYT